MRKFSLLGIALCALPLLAQPPARRVVVPCRLASTSLSLSAEDSPDQGRGFFLHVRNDSKRAISMPATPELGWRVQTLGKRGWKLKAEGGPVRLINPNDRDQHVVVSDKQDAGPMVQILPTGARDFNFFLPGADAALTVEPQLTKYKLSVYWAASPELAQSYPEVPPCALAAEWTVTMVRR